MGYLSSGRDGVPETQRGEVYTYVGAGKTVEYAVSLLPVDHPTVLQCRCTHTHTHTHTQALEGRVSW